MKFMLTTGLLAGLLATPFAALAEQGLLESAKAGNHRAALNILSAEPAQVKRAEADGTTALHWAIHQGNLALVSALLQAGADANARNDYGVTPLSEAAIRADADIVRALLDAGAEVESPNAYGQTALMVVARSGRTDTARLLLHRGADVNARETWRGQSALMWAAAQCQPEMVRLLIQSGADPDARSVVNDWERQVSAEPRAQWRPIGGLTPLLLAAREGCLESTRALLEGGADPDLSDPEGVVPLFMATNNLHFDVAAHLLAHGANPNQWDWRGRTPLYAAVDLNTLPHGGRPDRPSLDDTTSLGLIRLLLQAGANPNIPLKLFPPYRYLKDDRGADEVLRRGATPLLRAAKALDVEAIQLLLEHGAHTELANDQGTTPLMVAAGLGSTPIDTRGYYDTPDVQDRAIASLQLLLDAGADVNATDANGQTPIYGAAYWGWTSVAAFLVDNGADLQVSNADGRTPLDAATNGIEGRGRGALALTAQVNEETAAFIKGVIEGSQ